MKRIIYIIFLLGLLPVAVLAEETIFKFHSTPGGGERIFYVGNKEVAREILTSNPPFSKIIGEIPDGIAKEYDLNGKLIAEYNYQNGNLKGAHMVFNTHPDTSVLQKERKSEKKFLSQTQVVLPLLIVLFVFCTAYLIFMLFGLFVLANTSSNPETKIKIIGWYQILGGALPLAVSLFIKNIFGIIFAFATILLGIIILRRSNFGRVALMIFNATIFILGIIGIFFVFFGTILMITQGKVTHPLKLEQIASFLGVSPR